MSFSHDFLIGASTAAHQVEGNNIHSDFWAQEQMEHSNFAEPSLDAVDHYHRYADDIALMASAGLNAYRFGIEWARIEPEEGKFDETEIEHYRNVIRCCKENGVEPIVTMHHFSSPKWLISKGGWEAESTVEDFKKYCVYVIDRLGSELTYVCTINEANMGLQMAAIAKRYMTQMQARAAAAKTAAQDTKNTESSAQVGFNIQSIMAARKAAAAEAERVFALAPGESAQTFLSPRSENGDALIMRAHEAARNAMKSICPHLKIGLTLSLHDFQPLAGGEEIARKEWTEEFIHYLPYIQNDDFFGLQNYTRTCVDATGSLPAPEGAELTQMNYEFYPEALEHVIRKVAENFKGEIIVTENGIATSDDTRRVEFIRRTLEGVQHCITDGIPVKGYCYWSLMDNFEWQKGFSMTFGLITVDRKNGQTRTAKPSLAYLGSFAKSQI
ncbi:MAG: glycoside hydrolase family 1 protein [Subdoligranulum sp.]|nr:glycoside hydrolase family 1 protein [Subdoligranulum sp.]